MIGSFGLLVVMMILNKIYIMMTTTPSLRSHYSIGTYWSRNTTHQVECIGSIGMWDVLRGGVIFNNIAVVVVGVAWRRRGQR